MNQEINTPMHYLDRKSWFMDLIRKITHKDDLLVVEAMIEVDYAKVIMEQTNQPWLAKSHCNDLLNLCLLHRCELMVQHLFNVEINYN